MATYIPGVQSYMPEMKTFTPDYKFLSSVLDTKTNRYNTNYKQLNDLYSKVVYADLSRADTKETRSQYAEDLAPKLEKISGMDLSLQQNVDAARGLFKPFYEDDLIVRDMVATKSYQKDVQYANSLKNSSDDERRKMYWDTGIKAMNYQMEDFVNASRDQALTMPIPKYTPDADLYNTAIKLLQESGFGDGTEEIMPGPNGNFLIRRKNGDLIAADALDYIQKAMYNDPRVKDAYYTDAFVQSRNGAATYIQNGQASSIEEGQRMWASNEIATQQAILEKQGQKITEGVNNLNGSKTSWEIYRDNHGIIPGSDNEKYAKSQYELYNIASQQQKINKDLKQTAAVSQQGSSTQDLLNRAYNINMQMRMGTDLANAAKSFSRMGAEIEFKGETEKYKREQDFIYFQAEERIKQANRMSLAERKAKLKGGAGYDPLVGLGLRTEYNDAETLNVTTLDPIKINEQDAAQFEMQSTDEMANFIIEAIQATQPENQAGNMFNFSLKPGENLKLSPGSPSSKGGNTIYEMLHKTNADGELVYADRIKQLYGQYNNLINPVVKTRDGVTYINDVIVEGGENAASSPFFNKYPSVANDAKVYEMLKGKSGAINQRRGRLSNADAKMKEHYKESFDLATAGGVTLSPEYNKIMSNVKGLTFNIFDDNGNLKPKDQFVAEYSSAARPIEMPYYRTLPNGNKVKLTLDYIKANRREFPNINDSQLANFNVQSRMFPGKISNTKYYTSKGQHYITYETKSTSIGGKYGGSSRDYMFNTEDAKIDGAEAYDAMYDVLIKTQNDTYNSQADEGAGKGTTSSAFTSYNMGEALRGNPAYTSAAEVVQNPTYIVDIIPKDFSLASIETIQLTRDFINQYNTTPKASTGLVMRTGETENYNDRSSPQANLAGRIIEKYLIELKAFSANPKLTGLTPSNATLKYQPVFGNAKEDKNYAAYTLSNIDAAWLKKNFADEFENDAMGGKARIYSDLTYAFDKNFDMSDRKQGRYNFSEVDNQINSTENHQYSYIVDNGGTFNITRGLDNEYNVRIQTQLFNPETNNMELQPAQTFNFNEYLATKNIDVTNNKDYGAYLIEQYLMEQKASNENASSANSKIKGKK